MAAGFDHPDTGSVKFQAGSDAGKIDLRDAVLVAGSFGYKLPSGFRFELEFSRVAFPAKGVVFANSNNVINPLSGHVAEGALIANIAYDIPIAPNWAATVGVGLGGAQISPSIIEFSSGTNVFRDDTAFAWQFIAGLVWSAAPQLDVQLDIRYRGVNGTNHLVGEPSKIAFESSAKRSGNARIQILLPAAASAAAAPAAATSSAATTAATSTAAAAAAAAAASTAAAATATAAASTASGPDLHRLLRLRQVEPDG